MVAALHTKGACAGKGAREEDVPPDRMVQARIAAVLLRKARNGRIVCARSHVGGHVVARIRSPQPHVADDVPDEAEHAEDAAEHAHAEDAAEHAAEHAVLARLLFLHRPLSTFLVGHLFARPGADASQEQRDHCNGAPDSTGVKQPLAQVSAT